MSNMTKLTVQSIKARHQNLSQRKSRSSVRNVKNHSFQKRYLRTHTYNVHPKAKDPLTCDICFKSFTCKKYLRQHKHLTNCHWVKKDQITMIKTRLATIYEFRDRNLINSLYKLASFKYLYRGIPLTEVYK